MWQIIVLVIVGVLAAGLALVAIDEIRKAIDNVRHGRPVQWRPLLACGTRSIGKWVTLVWKHEIGSIERGACEIHLLDRDTMEKLGGAYFEGEFSDPPYEEIKAYLLALPRV